MNYLYAKVEEAEFKETTPLRRALRAHLRKVSAALRAVEWVDSGDWAPEQEEEDLRDLLGPQAELRQVVTEGEILLERLADLLRVASEVKPG